jgi:trehalose 6-phosphate phosphatase
MKYILSPTHLTTLHQAARTDVLLAFDFDGTLAPLVTDPRAAYMTPRTHRLLQQVALRYPCVIVSGRRRDDIVTRVQDVRLQAVIGNHGLEHAPATGRANAPSAGHTRQFQRIVERWRSALIPTLQALHTPITLENKRESLTIHMRRSPKAMEAVMTCVEALSPAPRVIHGKHVINLVPRGAPHKGDAIQRCLHTLQKRRAMFVGDDITDEDGFQLDTSISLGIRVGYSRTSHASFYLRAQREIDALLHELLLARTSAKYA